MAARPKTRPVRLTAPAADPTRAKLLAAAGEIFAERGFEAATVRDICSRAGANVAAVNYYFRDKQGLYLEILCSSVSAAEDSDMQRALVSARSPEAALRVFITVMLRRVSNNDGAAHAVRIVAHEFARPSKAFAQVVNQVIRPNYGKLREILSDILRLDPDHETTRMCAHSIIGQIIHYAHARPVIALLWPGFSMTSQRSGQVANHIVEFSLCSLRALAQQTTRTTEERMHGGTSHNN